MQSSSTLAALAGIGTALDGIDHAERRTLAHEVRLALIEQSRLALARLEALTGLLVAEADRARSSIVARGTPTTSWLQASGSSTRGEATRRHRRPFGLASAPQSVPTDGG